MEPYASSTAELVTELLEYQPKNLKMTMLEATALLAGIIVDTKSFTFRTGARTFDAASYLRSHGADTVLVQELLKEDMNQYLRVAKAIKMRTFIKMELRLLKLIVMITTISAYCAIGRHVINDDRDYCIICCCETWRESHWN